MMRQLKHRLIKQAEREYQPGQRMLALGFEAVFFLIILPLAFVRAGAALDGWSGLPSLSYQPLNTIFGLLIILSGWLFAIWSIHSQFTIGRGTPIPLMATQKLIIQPPYSYCRNPMALGAIVMYTGVSVLVGSIGTLIIVLFASSWLLLYIKRIEEKEMEIRFGQEYTAYKQQTPFIIPRFHR